MLFRNRDKEVRQSASVKLASYTVLGVVATVFFFHLLCFRRSSHPRRTAPSSSHTVIPLTTPISGVSKDIRQER